MVLNKKVFAAGIAVTLFASLIVYWVKPIPSPGARWIGISDDGKVVTSGDKLRLFSKYGDLIWSYDKPIFDVDISEDGSRIAACGGSYEDEWSVDEILVFSPEDNTPLWTLSLGRPYTASSTGVKLSSDGNYLLIGWGDILRIFASDNTYIWAASMGETLDKYGDTIAISPDGLGVVAVTYHEFFYRENRIDGADDAHDPDFCYGSREVSFSSDGLYIAVAYGLDKITLVDASDPTGTGIHDDVIPILPGYPYTSDRDIVGASISPDGSYIATADGKLVIYRHGEIYWEFDPAGYATEVKVSPDSSKILVGTTTGKVYLFDGDGNPIWDYQMSSSIAEVDMTDDFVVATSIDSDVLMAGPFEVPTVNVWAISSSTTAPEGRVLLSWDPVYLAENYILQLENDPTFEDADNIYVTENGYLTPELEEGTYYWRVKGLKTGSVIETEWSQTQTLLITGVVEAPPPELVFERLPAVGVPPVVAPETTAMFVIALLLFVIGAALGISLAVVWRRK